MNIILSALHGIYKRYQWLLEAIITAAGLALLVAVVLVSLPVYPPNWAPVLVALVAIFALKWQLAAFVLATLAVLYPVFTISLYLAVLVLAVAILGQRPFSHYLGATVLILATPWLAQYNFHWIVPILAGLWWGSVNGFWIGWTAAFWGKLLGGMVGLASIDWLLIGGEVPLLPGIMQRFHGISALDTLLKLLEPFAPDTTILLYNLLQITIWGIVAALVGVLAERQWIYFRYPWSTFGACILGGAVLLGGHLVLVTWLVEAAPISLDYNQLTLMIIVAVLFTGSLEVMRQYLELPVAPRMPIRRASQVSLSDNQDVYPMPQMEEPIFEKSPLQSVRVSHSNVSSKAWKVAPKPVPLPELPEWRPPEQDSGLILLELD